MSSFDFTRVLTTGANGMIGSYIDFGKRTDRAELDVLDEAAVMRFVKKFKPRVIIHLAGATDTTKCEKDPLYAYELNVRGTYNVAKAARAVGAVLVYASTTRVFKGDKKGAYTEKDIPEPTTVYGRTKHLGELVVAALVPHHIIARTSWVFGGGPKLDNKFYGAILKQIGGKEIVALNDVRGCPTYGKDYIEAVKKLLMKGKYGTFHIVNSGAATRVDTVRAIVAQLKSDVKVRDVDRSHFASGSSLPTNESVTSKNVKMRPWQAALAEYVAEEWPAPSQGRKGD